MRTGIYNELVKSFGRNNVGTKYPKIGEEEKLQKDYQPNSFRKISTMDPELIGKPSAEPEMTAFEKRMGQKIATALRSFRNYVLAYRQVNQAVMSCTAIFQDGEALYQTMSNYLHSAAALGDSASP